MNYSIFVYVNISMRFFGTNRRGGWWI